MLEILIGTSWLTLQRFSIVMPRLAIFIMSTSGMHD